MTELFISRTQAEYQAIIKALEIAKEYTNESIILASDSELVIKQLNGEYKVKNSHLRILYRKVKHYLQFYSSVKFLHVPRTNQWIKQADKLCNDLLNKQHNIAIIHPNMFFSRNQALTRFDDI
ncbi:MAG: ribonuclease HI family protein [Candidatus Hodarchaeales archaeon]|jgi:ribonuclease HI